jgi:urocanate hydratase
MFTAVPTRRAATVSLIRSGNGNGKTDTVNDSDRISNPRQNAVYRNYLQLQSIRADQFHNPSTESLAGRLVACIGFGQQGAELALATTIAGGAFLGIDSSSEHLKAAVRNGSCDFMVNTLDESLRVLKNELRKQKALSVGLLGDASAILPAMVDRGVQPDLIADTASSESEAASGMQRDALLQLIERGARNLNTQTEKFSRPTERIEVVWTADTIMDLKRMDTFALEQLPPEDTIRRRWLHQASGCFHRQRPLQRVLDLQPAELTPLLSAFQNAVSTATIQASVSVDWQTADGSKHSMDLQRAEQSRHPHG